MTEHDKSQNQNTEKQIQDFDVPMSNGPLDPRYVEKMKALREMTDVLNNVQPFVEASRNKPHELDPFGNAPANSEVFSKLPIRYPSQLIDGVPSQQVRGGEDLNIAPGSNTIERKVEKERMKIDAVPVKTLKQSGRADAGNQVESDEIFTARASDIKPLIPPEVEQKYHRIGNKFYQPDNADRVAFEDKGNKLQTASNSESVAESMVRIAHARGWDEIKVSGSETFRREAWLEAASRGMHVIGYSPSKQDKAELAKRVPENKIEKENETFRARETGRQKAQEKLSPNQTDLASSFTRDSSDMASKKYPELAGAYSAMAAIDKQAEFDGLTPRQRAVVAARVQQNIVNSIERGRIPEVVVKEVQHISTEAKSERNQTR